MTDAQPADSPRLATIILGGERRWTREELAADLGVDVGVARRLWRAMGFADVGEARAFADSDRDATGALLSLVDDGTLDLDSAVEVVRSIGRTTSRIAEWQAELVSRLLVERGVLTAGVSPDEEQRVDVRDYAAHLLPVVERLLAQVWRRQLVAALERLDAGPGRGTDDDRDVSVVFADVVGFTRLSRRLDPADLAELVETFETVSVDVVAAAGARLVKTLGDEVLFVADTPSAAVEAALALLAAHDDLHTVPGDDEASLVDDDPPPSFRAGGERVELRIGIATGPVVNHLGDIFGTTVNLASRLTTLAEPGGLLVDERTAAGIGGREGWYDVQAGPVQSVRGVGQVRPYSVAARVVRPRSVTKESGS